MITRAIMTLVVAVAAAHFTAPSASGDCSNNLYKIGDTVSSYSTIQNAYWAMKDGETIEIQALEFTGGLLLDQNTVVTLRGGYGCDFTTNPGHTIVSDKLTVKDGKVTIDNLTIKLSAACIDGVKNGTETDVDCGGTCPPCADTKVCLINGDCQSHICTGGFCAVASCTDAVKNGNETDVDCGGGTCPACASTKACLANSDCSSNICNNHVCQ